MRRILAGLLCALLPFLLSACGKAGAETTSPPSPAPTVRPAPTPTPTAAPTPTPPATVPDPIDEAALLRDPEFSGSFGVLDVIPAGDGFFVWYGPAGAALDDEGKFMSDWSGLTWVDARTGEKVPLLREGEEVLERVSATEARRAEVRTAGRSHIDGARILPVTYRFTLTEDNWAVTERDPWQPVAAPLELGMARASVVADARAGVNDVALVFVPPATEEGVANFIAGHTNIPAVSTYHDAAQNAMFITLHDTVLQSGELAQGCEDWVYDFLRDNDLEYPCGVAAGSLGRDNRFFTKAAISTNGTDTTVSLLLTGEAEGYTAEITYLAEDMYPTLRLVFR